MFEATHSLGMSVYLVYVSCIGKEFRCIFACISCSDSWTEPDLCFLTDWHFCFVQESNLEQAWT